jgi:hypothetical protein
MNSRHGTFYEFSNVYKSESVLCCFEIVFPRKTSFEISLLFQVRKWNSSVVMNCDSRGRNTCIILSLWQFPDIVTFRNEVYTL